MSKIYSRPRIRIPKIFIADVGDRSFRNKKKIVKIFIMMVIAFSTVKLVLDAILPVFDTLCKDKAKGIATIISNEQATVVMREHKYEELFSLEKDNDGNIIMIKSNVSAINEIISDVAVKIQNEIDNKGKDSIEISMRYFYRIQIASRWRARNSYKNINYLRSEFTAQGINQTLHRVYLQVECEVSILTPYKSISEKITNQVLIAENVIVGRIPSTYYNLNGLDNSNAIDIIE